MQAWQWGHFQSRMLLESSSFASLREAVDKLDRCNSATYAVLLRQCAKTKALPEGRKVHQHIARNGLEQDTFLGNLLVHMYGCWGCLEESVKVFERLPQKNVYTWNMMLTAYAQNGHVEDAWSTFEKMFQRDVVSWTAMVGAYAHAGHSQDARSVFDKMPGRGVVAWTAMLTAYTETGHVQDAERMFDSMPQRDFISWNAMIVAYAENGHLEDANCMFDKMPQQNSSSCNAMLTAYTQHGMLETARNMFEKMPLQNVISWNVMIQGYAQNGHLQDARSLLDKMPEQNVVAWNSMIQGYASKGHIEDAKIIFNRMPQPDLFSWTAMITAYGQLGHLQDARLVFEQMQERDVVAWNAMIQASSQNGSLEEVRSLFNQMPARNSFSWNIIVAAFVQAGILLDARGAFERMPQQNVISWNAMIQAYGNTTHLKASWSMFEQMPQRDIVTWTTMLAAYAQDGHLENAKNLFDKMPQRDRVAWSAMLAANAQNGHGKDALELFQIMDLEGVTPDGMIYVSVLDACASIAAVREGRLIHSEITEHGVLSDVMVGTALVNMYGKCGYLEEARTVCDRLPRQDGVSWNAMIAAYAHNGHRQDALELLRIMQLEGVKPEAVTFVSILYTCSHAGLLADGWQQFASLCEDHGTSPEQEHYVCMIDLLGRTGKLAEAEELVNSMPFEPGIAAWMALLSACKSQGDVKRGKLVAERVLALDPQNAAPYVLLSNVHVEAGKKDDIEKVRQLMDASGAKNKAGFSLIKIKDRSHKFSVTDMQHQHKEEIYAELRQLSRELKQAGYIFTLYDLQDENKELYHSELLAIAFGLVSTPRATLTPIHVVQNLRICVDCHTATKFISRARERSIVVRDANRFHQFEHGVCSCGDYW